MITTMHKYITLFYFSVFFFVLFEIHEFVKDLPAGVEVKDICIGAGGLGLDCHCGPLG